MEGEASPQWPVAVVEGDVYFARRARDVGHNRPAFAPAKGLERAGGTPRARRGDQLFHARLRGRDHVGARGRASRHPHDDCAASHDRQEPAIQKHEGNQQLDERECAARPQREANMARHAENMHA